MTVDGKHGVALPADEQHEPADRPREHNPLDCGIGQDRDRLLECGRARWHRRRIVARPEDGPEAEEDRAEATRGGQHSEARPRRSPLGRELDRLLRPDGLRGGRFLVARPARARERDGPPAASRHPIPVAGQSRRRVSSQTVL